MCSADPVYAGTTSQSNSDLKVARKEVLYYYFFSALDLGAQGRVKERKSETSYKVW